MASQLNQQDEWDSVKRRGRKVDEAKGIIRKPRVQNLQRLGCERWQAGLANSEDKGEGCERWGCKAGRGRDREGPGDSIKKSESQS